MLVLHQLPTWTLWPAPSWPHLDEPYFGGEKTEKSLRENPGKF